MGCGTCSACGIKTPTGCRNNGSCGTGGCNKLNVFDWLNALQPPSFESSFNISEVRFKNTSKGFFRNVNNLNIVTGDAVIAEAEGGGYDLGHISLMGELVRLQMKKKNVSSDSAEVRKIYRRASENEIRQWKEQRDKESSVMFRTREVIREMKLGMKLTDVEYQGDGRRATFYYSAEERVDFRELIKKLATEFKIRVEMEQISMRQESGRLGGIGSCGRELCCSTWLTDFKQVTTSAAQYQNLSLNPLKLSGQCGRLKCCLNYELDQYMEALKFIPTIEKPIETERGNATLQKTDIFKKIMWFSYAGESDWVPLTVERVNQLLELNQKGVKPSALVEEETIPKAEKKLDFVDVVGQATFREGRKKKHKNRKGRHNR